MYQHADQTWKNKPRCLSEHHQELFAKRLGEYVAEKGLRRVVIVYHGGEPLLFGVENIIRFTELLRARLSPLHCEASFGIQTNGTLLKEEHLKTLQEHGITVSLSIDGPKEMHDQHRVDLKNRPTFDKVYAALQLLRRYPETFSGCIAVINPHSEPRRLFEFFDANGVSEFNILIPDANHVALPAGRDKNPDLYKNWLIEAFDCWFDHYSHLKCKYFDWLLKAVLGHTSETDSFGLGDISLLVLETDGTYHNHDVLKITEENSSSLGLNLEEHPILAAESAEKIRFHRTLLTKEGLSPQCQSCKHLLVCGGGFIGHRFGRNGYLNPTVYCEEMYALIDHITSRLKETLHVESQKQGLKLVPEFTRSEMEAFCDSRTSSQQIHALQEHIARKEHVKFLSLIPYALNTFKDKQEVILACKKLSFEEVKPALLQPTSRAWLRAMHSCSVNHRVYNIDEKELPPDPDYFDQLLSFVSKKEKVAFTIQSQDRWYRLSLGTNITIEHPPATLREGMQNLQEALEILENYDAALYQEMALASRHIQLVKDSNAHPDKDVSFSDETIPGALFIGTWKSDGLLSPYVVAASLIHEHLHQKLYLLMSRFELFTDKETLIYSPWPKTFRPPHGVLHAVYVFTHVARFWSKMQAEGRCLEIAEHALSIHLENLRSCLNDVKNNISFTPSGQLFFDCLWKEFLSLSSQHSLTMV